MALATYKAPVGTVEFKGGSFEVKGLSLNEISSLVHANKDDMERLINLFDRAVSGARAYGQDFDLSSIATELATAAPVFVSTLIALACTENEEFPVLLTAARQLTMPVQVDALRIIGSLTFEEAGGVKKFVEGLSFLRGSLRETAPTAAPQENAKVD